MKCFHHILILSYGTIIAAEYWVNIMNKQSFLGNKRWMLVAGLMLAFVVAVLLSRILLADRPETNTIINDVMSVLCALAATLLFLNVWLSTSNRDASKKIWSWMVIGLLAWTVAETIWAFYEVVLGQEVPYPSIADLFWLSGYAMICVALLTQYRLFQVTPSQQQKRMIAVLVVVFFLIGGFVILGPIIQGFDPEEILASLLNIAYPLFDLLLLVLALAVIFSLEQGRFVLSWHILGLGLVFLAAADLMFSYADWNEIYFPDSTLNGITLLIDTLYYVAYLTLGLAAYTYRLISNSLQSVTMDIVLRSLTRSNILVFVAPDGTVISLSDNFSNLVHSRGQNQYVKKPLCEALKIDQSVMADLIAKTIEHEALSTQPVMIRDVQGQPRDVWLTSLAVYNDQKALVCIALVFRTNLTPQDGEEHPLSEEQRMLVNYYLTQAGTYRSEENQVIKTYFLEQISLLYSLIQQFSGTPVADKLLVYLNQVASRNEWQFTFTGQVIGIPNEYEGQTLAERVSVLLQEAKTFATDMINLRVVAQEMKLLDNGLSADNLRYIDKYNLRSTANPVP